MIRYAYLLYYGHADDAGKDLLSAWSSPLAAQNAWMRERHDRGWSGWRERKPNKDYMFRATADSGAFLAVQQVRLADVP